MTRRRPKPPHVWVVEMLDDGEWEPTSSMGVEEPDGERLVEEEKHFDPARP